MTDPARKRILNAATESVCRALAGYDLANADKIVFDATAVALMAIFSGESAATVRTRMGVAPITAKIGEHFESLAALEVTQLHAQVRLTLYPAHFAGMAGTRFGDAFQDSLASAHLDNRRKLN